MALTSDMYLFEKAACVTCVIGGVLGRDRCTQCSLSSQSPLSRWKPMLYTKPLDYVVSLGYFTLILTIINDNIMRFFCTSEDAQLYRLFFRVCIYTCLL